MKREGDPVKLTRSWWDGPEPQPGDGLRTRRGRCYVILRVAGKTLHCMVANAASITGTMFRWEWSRR